MTQDLSAAVDAAFAAHGLKPRDNQAETCVSVLKAFLVDRKPIVVVDAPTGTGKSVIGIVVSTALKTLEAAQRSVIVTATNALARQYDRDFKSPAEDVFPLYGANQYPCSLRNAVLKKNHYTAEQCYRKSRYFHSNEAITEQAVAEHCGSCEFSRSRALKEVAPVIVTNYSYFIIDRIYISKLPKNSYGSPPPCFDNRDLVIFDEAHLINEQFVNHMAIFFSAERAESFHRDMELLFGPQSGPATAYGGAFERILENVRRSTIGPKNVEKFMRTLHKFYNFMCEQLEDRANWSRDESNYDRLKALHGKYHGLFCKIDDYLKYGFEVAVHCDEDAEELTVKPIFVKECFTHLRARFNLFLSATLEQSFLAETLALNPDEVEYIRAPYAFNRDDKRIRIPPRPQLIKLNYQTLKDPAVVAQVVAKTSEYAQLHPNESGIIITTSFSMAEQVGKGLTSPHRVLVHQRGQKVDDLVAQLKSSDEPTVLISPSLFEGIDLPGDASRFQVITKAPYYSLADRRMSIIMRRHRTIYTLLAIMRLTQGMGRSTRSKGDVSTSYFLDKGATRLFNSKYNYWRDQFDVQSDFGLPPKKRRKSRKSGLQAGQSVV